MQLYSLHELDVARIPRIARIANVIDMIVVLYISMTHPRLRTGLMTENLSLDYGRTVIAFCSAVIRKGSRIWTNNARHTKSVNSSSSSIFSTNIIQYNRRTNYLRECCSTALMQFEMSSSSTTESSAESQPKDLLQQLRNIT